MKDHNLPPGIVAEIGKDWVNTLQEVGKTGTGLNGNPNRHRKRDPVPSGELCGHRISILAKLEFSVIIP